MRILLVLITVLCVAACGASGSSGGTGTDAASGVHQGLKLARCMRAHGVPNFPDPSSAGGINIQQGSGIDPQSPAFQAAQQACRKVIPGGAGGPIKATKAQFTKALAFARCMRTHGVPRFPDPVASIPGGSGPIVSLAGMLFKPGQGLDPQSPAFQQAASHCGVSLPKPPG
ncbi:MAG TPA: hypothetical protein VGF68_09070 [Solirubrobacteraceae bacterium]|jgi:hypothetical protein